MECDTFVSEQFEVESDKVRSHGCRRLNAPVLLRRDGHRTRWHGPVGSDGKCCTCACPFRCAAHEPSARAKVPLTSTKRAQVKYTPEHILAEYEYQSTSVEQAPDGKIKVFPKVDAFEFQTERKVPKLGIMLVGLGGNNGTTFTAGIMANKKGLTWQTKEREIKANYFGSLTQASTVRLGNNAAGDPVYVPLKNVSRRAPQAIARAKRAVSER